MSGETGNRKAKIVGYIVLAGFVGMLVVAGFVQLADGASQTALPQVQESVQDADKELLSVRLVSIELITPDNVRKSVGSGVVYHVSEDGVWIATAAHVLEKKEQDDVICLMVGEKTFTCREWTVTENADLAFLYISDEEIADDGEPGFEPAVADKVSYDDLQSGEYVTARGYRKDKVWEYSGQLTNPWIYVEDFEQYMMLAQCEVHHGMSGGGLYDSAGNFIGMVCGGNEEGELVAVPWHVMQARFEEL